MSFISDTDIEQLVKQFEAHTLPKEEWTHQAHLVVGFYYAWHYGYSEALQKVREGIITYNESVGTPNTDSSGYHETITQYWLKIFYWYLNKEESGVLEKSLQQFFQSPLIKKYSLLTYYTKEKLYSPLARRNWVEPDKKPFPFSQENE